MNRLWLPGRNLLYHRRAHLAVTLGVVAGCAALTGALLVGDSLRGSLRAEALGRLGDVDHVLRAPHYFRESLADDLAAAAPVLRGPDSTTWGTDLWSVSRRAGGPSPRVSIQALRLRVAPAIALRGSMTHADTRAVVAGVRVWGIDARFSAAAAPSSPFGRTPGDDRVVLNEPLASALGARVGDEVLLRIPRPAAISPETLLGRRDAPPVMLRLRVSDVVPAAGLGAFALDAQQRAPRNAFVSLPMLQRALQHPGRVNTLLLAGGAGAADDEALAAALASAVTPADLGLRLRVDATLGYVALESDALLLPPPVEAAARRAADSIGCPVVGVLAYLANSIARGDTPERAVPYSTVVAVAPASALVQGFTWLEGGPPVPGELALNQWAAEDLGADVGDVIELTYYELLAAGRLATRTARFRLAGIVALRDGAADPNLVPPYPGVTDTDRISDWDPPFPIDMRRIRDRDEAYWDTYRATPKAFVTLEEGQRLWARDADRFGGLTSLRVYTLAGDSLATTAAAFAARMRRELDVRSAGFVFDPIRRRALEAGQGTTDFGGLFIGFSALLIASAALLVALLFRLGVERRAAEIGLLLATGFSPHRVRALLLTEGLAVAAVGTALGLIAARGYAWLMLAGLRSWWLDAVQAPFLALHATSRSYAIGGGASLAVAVGAIVAAVGGLVRRPARTLLAGPYALGAESEVGGRYRARVAGSVGVLAALCAAGLLVASWWGDVLPRTAAFFVGGTALLAAGLAALAAWLASEPRDRQTRVLRLGDATPSRNRKEAEGVRNFGPPAPLRSRLGSTAPSRSRLGSTAPSRSRLGPLLRLGIRNARRHRGRSLLTAALIAFAAFVITALQALRLTPPADIADRHGGTGGFTLLAESDVPLLHDLNTAEGRAALNMSPEELSELDGVTSYRLRRRDGDETSCLNVYRPTQPRLLGASDTLIDRGGFAFAATRASSDDEQRNPWLLLRRALPDGAIPAIADEAAARWQLHVNLGDTLSVQDERGAAMTLRLVALLKGSVLQGEVILHERDFIRLYPSASGYAVHLIESAPERTAEIKHILERTLSDFGLAVTPTAQRLADLQAVQNTYLSTFQALGGLGLLLGVLGLTAIMLRNVNERRGELALLRAVGFTPRAIGVLVLVENAFLAAAGLAIGVVSAAVVVAPHMIERGAPVPWLSLLGLFGGILLAGVATGAVALVAALREPLLPALRAE